MILILHTRLDAESLDVTYEDFLWCVSCFASENPGAQLRETPSTLMLDQLARVAWLFGIKLDIQFVPAEGVMPPKIRWRCAVCGAFVRCKAPTGNALDAWVPVRHRNRATGEPCAGTRQEALADDPQDNKESQ